jgi:hypothetical protein
VHGECTQYRQAIKGDVLIASAAAITQSHHLLNAAKAGDGDEVKKCLDAGVNVNCRDNEVGNLLVMCGCPCVMMMAASNGNHVSRDTALV